MSLPEIVYCCAILAAMTLLLLKCRHFQLSGIKKGWVIFAFYLKVAAGFLMTFIYTSYYPDRSKADIFKYFDDSEVMYQSLKSEPLDYVKMVIGVQNDNARFDSLYYFKMNNWYRKYETVTYNDSHTIIRINALIRLVSFGYFQVHNLIFIILSFLGLMALFKTYSRYFTGVIPWLYIAVFLIPSVVFWSSGAMKESVLFFAIGIFLYALQQMIFRSVTAPRIILACIGVFLLIFTKMYVLAVLLPVVIGNLWIILTNNRYALFKQIISLLCFVCAGVIIGRFYPQYNVLELFVGKLHDFIGLARFENAGSLIEPIPLEPKILSFLMYTPQAIVTTLFRPFPGEISSVLMIPAFLENVMLVLCIVLAVFFHREKVNQWRIILFCLSFCLVLSAITGLTTPVLGALVRYRIPALPFLYMALFLIIDFERVGRFLNIKSLLHHE